MSEQPFKLSVGILGFGALGQHLFDCITQDPNVARYAEAAGHALASFPTPPHPPLQGRAP